MVTFKERDNRQQQSNMIPSIKTRDIMGLSNYNIDINKGMKESWIPTWHESIVMANKKG